MIQPLALAALLAAAGWLAGLAVLCFVSPATAGRGLARMGGSWAVHIGEHALRALVGLAMVARADLSRVPHAFTIGGWFLVGSSVLILILPRRWHHAYARWWAARIPLPAYRWLALPTLALAGALSWAAW